MSFVDTNGNSGMVMPVSPMYGGSYYGGNNGYGNGFGGDGAWWLLVLILAMNGGWGNNGFGGNGGNNAFPWLVASNTNTDNLLSSGFNQAATAGTLNSIQNSVTSGFGDTQLGIAGVNQNICQTGAGITAAVTNGFAQSEIADNARQIANMQQAFNSQTATTAAINGISSQLADCCCENRLATANLTSTVLAENCADREALSNGIRDIITAQNAGTQRILDMMCQDKIDAKNEKIAELQNQVTMQNLAASQAAQTAALVADNTAQTQYIVNRVAPYPIPAYPVSNPYGCNNFGFGYGNTFGWNNGFNNGFGAVGFGNGTF